MAFIDPPRRIPVWIRLGLWLARRVTGRDLLIGRLLAWSPRAALSSGVMEALVEHGRGRLDARLLQLVRLQVSYAAACPFCIDMNGAGHERQAISNDEIDVLRGRRSAESIPTLTPRERLAIGYARQITVTPLRFTPGEVAALKPHFDESEIVALAVTAAQVNYWTRLIQALGVPPAGFSETRETHTI
jgi:AhpD family alkylhydroperoxidase